MRGSRTSCKRPGTQCLEGRQRAVPGHAGCLLSGGITLGGWEPVTRGFVCPRGKEPLILGDTDCWAGEAPQGAASPNQSLCTQALFQSPFPSPRHSAAAGALTREAGGAPEPPSGFSRTVRPGGQTAFCLLPGLLPACAHVSHGESELLPRVRGSISGGLCFPSLQ